MIKRIWTFKRIILAIIIFMCTIIVAISLQKSIMGTDKLQRDFGVALLFIVVLVCLLYFLYKLLIWNWISHLEEKFIDSVIFTKCVIRF